MTLDEIAALLEKNSVKWVPIIEDVQLGGTSDTKKQAVRLAAESTPGVRARNDCTASHGMGANPKAS